MENSQAVSETLRASLEPAAMQLADQLDAATNELLTAGQTATLAYIEQALRDAGLDEAMGEGVDSTAVQALAGQYVQQFLQGGLQYLTQPVSPGVDAPPSTTMGSSTAGMTTSGGGSTTVGSTGGDKQDGSQLRSQPSLRPRLPSATGDTDALMYSRSGTTAPEPDEETSEVADGTDADEGRPSLSPRSTSQGLSGSSTGSRTAATGSGADMAVGMPTVYRAGTRSSGTDAGSTGGRGSSAEVTPTTQGPRSAPLRLSNLEVSDNNPDRTNEGGAMRQSADRMPALPTLPQQSDALLGALSGDSPLAAQLASALLPRVQAAAQALTGTLRDTGADASTAGLQVRETCYLLDCMLRQACRCGIHGFKPCQLFEDCC